MENKVFNMKMWARKSEGKWVLQFGAKTASGYVPHSSTVLQHTQRCNVPQATVPHTFVCTCMCNTFVMIAQIVILITEFNKTNKNKERKKNTEKNFKMFVTFCNFFCEFPRNAVSPALYEREFSRVNFAKNNSSFSSFCLSLVSSLIFQLNTFALHFLSAIYLSFGLKFFWALFLWVVFVSAQIFAIKIIEF